MRSIGPDGNWFSQGRNDLTPCGNVSVSVATSPRKTLVIPTFVAATTTDSTVVGSQKTAPTRASVKTYSSSIGVKW